MRNYSIGILVILGLLAACNGKNGKDGHDGRPGVDAKAPTVSTRAANAQECSTGGFVITVDDETPNIVCNGATGLSGQNGSPGAPGTQITLVQLCPGTTMYPTTFVEVGVCVDDELWAVYSQNGGFLTKIPPGAYSSNGIGSSCNFTVAAHCVIQ